MTAEADLPSRGLADPGLAGFPGPTYRLVSIPGDGVGPDVVGVARRVLAAVGARFGFGIAWHEIVVGGAGIDAYGVPIRPEDLAACAASDAVLLGAVGGPRWDDPTATVRPEQALFAMRGGLGLFANLRPVSVHPALVAASPLRPELLDGVDMLIVRELTGGLYFGARGEAAGVIGARAAHDLLPYTEPEVARVARLAFELARGRAASGSPAWTRRTSWPPRASGGRWCTRSQPSTRTWRSTTGSSMRVPCRSCARRPPSTCS